MNIIIAGAGEVGYHLARLLSLESHDIVVIDNEKRVLQRVENELDVFVMEGNAYSIHTLEEAKIKDCDLLIAVTDSETTNITVSLVGKQMGAKKVIARVSNPEFLKEKDLVDFNSLGIDVMISPEEMAASEIASLVQRSAFTDTYEFEFGKLLMLGIHIGSESPLVNRSVKETSELNPNHNFIPLVINRQNESIIPRGSTVFEEDDHIYFVSLPSGVEQVEKLTGRQAVEIKNVMIMGGGKVGQSAAQRIKKGRRVKLFEKDSDRSFELADHLSDVLVINADCHNVRMLEEENLEEMDAFVAVTGNSETNIMNCLVAKNLGVKRTIALVENMDYINLSQSIGIDTFINKKLIAANNIFRYVRKGDVITITGLHGIDGELLEFEVNEDAEINDQLVKDVHFPKNAIVGGIVRKNRGKMVTGETRIKAGDRVVIFALKESIKEVERLFRHV